MRSNIFILITSFADKNPRYTPKGRCFTVSIHPHNELYGFLEAFNKYFQLFLMDSLNNRIPITKNGLGGLKKEYEELIKVKRPEVVERLSSSRKIGDMAEENEYTQAKQELAFIDGRISELEEVISKAILIDEGHGHCQEIKLGCKVTVKNVNKENIFHLVGEWEANPAEAKISHQSPLGRSLLGKKIGDKVEVEAPAGKIVYTIIKID